MSVIPNRNNFGLIRLVLATLVVLAHAPQMVDGDRHREILHSIFGTLTFGEFAVDGFFLVSGYLIVKSWDNSANFTTYLAKRILRIYPGFIIAFLVSLIVVGGIAGGHLADLLSTDGIVQAERMVLLRGPQLNGAFAALPDPQLNSPLWTVAYEFRCYLAVACLGALGLFRAKAVYVAVTALMLMLFLLIPKPSLEVPLAVQAVFGNVPDDLRFLTIFLCGGFFTFCVAASVMNGGSQHWRRWR